MLLLTASTTNPPNMYIYYMYVHIVTGLPAKVPNKADGDGRSFILRPQLVLGSAFCSSAELLLCEKNTPHAVGSSVTNVVRW